MFAREAKPNPDFIAMSRYFVFVHVDVDSNKSDAQRYGVSGIPDFRVLKKDGTQVHKWVGYGGLQRHLAEMNKGREMAGS